MKIVWASDIHLDHAEDKPGAFKEFADSVNAQAPDVLIVSGDISTGIGFEPHVRQLAGAIGCKLLWVRGNHDLWRTSFQAADELDVYLTGVLAGSHHPDFWGSLHTKDEVSMVSDEVCILGVNGWYDFTAGETKRAPFIMNDWHRISDFVHGVYAGEDERVISMRQSGLSTALAIKKLNAGYEQGARKFHLFTHVPQFVETCSYRGLPTRPEDITLYCNVSFGVSLRAWCKEHPDAHLTTYAGHTHFGKTALVEPNLLARVATAKYGSPKFEDAFEI